jgi:aspartokinase-like uncharacterized kinase
MTAAAIVVKVGGSLLELPGLGPKLAAWLGTLGQREVLLVPGGGTAADMVRDLDQRHGLGEEASHWLALRSLTLTAHLVAAILSPSQPATVVERIEDAPPLWQQGVVPVLDLHAFALQDELRPDHLPHGWNVTSDSLAARVAYVAGARALVLLKSATIPPEMSWEEAGRQGYVDPYFAQAVGRGVRVRAVNLRLVPH